MENNIKITRENMDTIIEEIMGVMESDWLSEESKPAEIERILIDNGLVAVVDEEEYEMNKDTKIKMEFSADEVSIISDAILALIYRTDEANRLLMDGKAKEKANEALAKYNILLTRINSQLPDNYDDMLEECRNV